MTRAQQMAHIRQHQVAFNRHQGYARDVHEYFDTYADDPALYWCLCSDLGITPLEPIPESVSGFDV